MKINNSELWLGDFHSYLDMQEKIEQGMAADRSQMQAYDPDGYPEEKVFGEQDYMMSLEGGTAIIDVRGQMTNRNSWFNPLMGLVSYPEIKNSVIAAVKHPDVNSILLSIDSPGGAVTGVSELSDFLKAVDEKYKPIEAHVGGQMASAAYWLGSNARRITGTKLSSVGSIGVLSVHMEMSKMLKDQGIEATVLRKGKYKALGNPYEPLSEEAKAKIDADMQVVYDEFVSTVANNRGVTADRVYDHMAEGQTFWGAKAYELGMIDAIGTIDSVVTQMHRDHNTSDIGSNFNAGELTMGKETTKVLTEEGLAALAAGASEEEAAALGADVLPEDEAADVSAEDQSSDEVMEEEGDISADAGDVEDKLEAKDEPAPKADPVVDLLKSQLAESTQQIADLRVELGEAKRKAEGYEASQQPLLDIAVQATQRMQVALGQAPSDMSAVGASAVIDQYQAVQKSFLSQFKVGAVSKEANKDERHSVVASPFNGNIASATKISKQ